ncbi:hypothetical protein [Photobacterium sp. J15]|uniref:hypothetical protein n=1 Tax=Photobacterium sp. J15 TaxID=265901 RepID=UPI0007E3D1CC|nr:hypothetical protein [Photobacterium sp. J15]
MSMRDRIKKSVAHANQQLGEREGQLLLNTNFDLVHLSPAIQNNEKYQALVQVIQSASSRNLSVAELEDNIRQLGDEAWELTQDMLSAAKRAM